MSNDMPDVIYAYSANEWEKSYYNDDSTPYIRKSIADDLVEALKVYHYGKIANVIELSIKIDELLSRYQALTEKGE